MRKLEPPAVCPVCGKNFFPFKLDKEGRLTKTCGASCGQTLRYKGKQTQGGTAKS